MPLAPLAHVVRSGFGEGVHFGSAIALGPDGAQLLALGEPGRPVLPRSALKPLQLVGMIRAGLRLDGELMALAASSHSGEEFHLAGVRRILEAAALGPDDLGNTPDLPFGTEARIGWQCAGRPASALAQNCSGKHAAMLATCRLNGWPLAGYLSAEHPLQRLIHDTVAGLAGEPVAATAVDGCGAPALAISLTGLARAFATVSRAAAGSPEGAVAAAIRAHPDWLGGTGREVTALVRAVPGLIAKDGAEAVYAAGLPDGRAVALKIADGADRARQVVMVALLRAIGAGGPLLEPLGRRPVLGHGREVGAVLPVDF